MKKYILILLIFFSACSTRTVYNINIDLLSFFEEPKLEQSIIFPASLTIDIFFFPGLELDLYNAGPGKEAQQGVIISFPSQDITELDSISVKLEIEAEIINNSLTDQITGDRISLYIAPLDTENIYTEGIRFDLFNVEVLLPGERVVFIQDFYLEEEGALLEILRTGTFRLGMGVFLKASTAFVPADYRLNKINLSTGFTPLELLK